MEAVANDALDVACRSTLALASPAAAGSNGEPLVAVAVVGFSADHLTGNIAIAAGATGLAAIADHLGCTGDYAFDALGEAANLMAGRIKRSLAEHGPVITITPPIVLRAVQLALSETAPSGRAQRSYDMSGGRAVTWFDFASDEQLTLLEAGGGCDRSGDEGLGACPDGGLAEGDVLLF
ncbi:MAG: chemotaxis protein CheX [Planctomycetota bacterium]